ncbi:MAG: prepilin-type N-terminal cleavage/methylation domain-containing protein [Verrucomicrobiota bacterium]
MKTIKGQHSKGFSLFEIVVAMVILGLIATSIFSILWQAGDTAAEIRMLDRRGEEVDRFVNLLRETIEGLPPDAALSITPAGDSESGYHELKLENTPTAFVFGELIGSSEESYIALRPGAVLADGTQGFDLALSRSDFVPEDSDGSGMAFRVAEGELLEEDENGRYWLPLLSNVSGASWRFWDGDSGEWLEEWTDDEAMPALMEFSLLDGFSSIPARVVYEVPDRLVDPEAAASAEETSVAAQTSSAAIETTGSAGGRPPGRGDGQGRGQGDGQRGPRGEGGPDGRGGPRGEGRGPGGDGAGQAGTRGQGPGQGQAPSGGNSNAGNTGNSGGGG